ncbi:MAG: DUF4230 domain-containing protein [Anaeromyxobacteraceae bacterium]
MRRLVLLVLFGLAIGVGVGLVLRLGRSNATALPDPPAVVVAVREVARLETLDVRLWKKISFAPEPEAGRTLAEDVAGWVRYSLNAPRGRAIVFADASVGLDLSRLDGSALRVAGREVFVVLPPAAVRVELRPGDTEVLGSNLDSAETARLLELAKRAFEEEVGRDRALQERARASAERAIRGLLLGLGFAKVSFVAELPPAGAPS